MAYVELDLLTGTVVVELNDFLADNPGDKPGVMIPDKAVKVLDPAAFLRELE